MDKKQQDKLSQIRRRSPLWSKNGNGSKARCPQIRSTRKIDCGTEKSGPGRIRSSAQKTGRGQKGNAGCSKPTGRNQAEDRKSQKGRDESEGHYREANESTEKWKSYQQTIDKLRSLTASKQELRNEAPCMQSRWKNSLERETSILSCNIMGCRTNRRSCRSLRTLQKS